MFGSSLNSDPIRIHRIVQLNVLHCSRWRMRASVRLYLEILNVQHDAEKVFSLGRFIVGVENIAYNKRNI